MAKRILNRREMRADFDAAETRNKEEEEQDEEEEDDDEEGDEEEGDEEGEGADDEEGSESGDEEGGGGEDDDEEMPKKKKKKKPAKVKVAKVAKPRSRSRAAKIVRMRVVWGVFDNSNKCVATYEYPRRKEADEHAVRLTTGPGKTHFVQPVKEAIEEPKEPKETKEKSK
jgi:cobalamin biosynthesis protein CobT